MNERTASLVGLPIVLAGAHVMQYGEAA